MEGTKAKDSDEALLRKIAEKKDSSAFDDFARRHTQSIYNLALHLTSNRMAAEDIVQETLLVLWSAARTYDASRGSARSWLMHIAAHKALKSRIWQDKEESRIKGRWTQVKAASWDSLPDGIAQEAGELRAVLRGLLGQLPELDRRLVALYYGGEISQGMISKLLGISQRTVSRRLAIALEQLQKDLKKAGYGAGTCGAWVLGAAVCSTYPMPPGVCIPDVSACDAAFSPTMPTPGIRNGGQGARGIRFGLRLALASVATLAVGWCALLCVTPGPVSGEAKPAKNSSPPSVAPASAPLPVPLTVLSHPARFKRIYDFDAAEQLQDFELSGKATYVAAQGKGGGGGVQLAAGGKMRLHLPQNILPWRLTYDVKVTPSAQFGLAFPGMRLLARFAVGSHTQISNGGWVTFSEFITESSHDRWVEYGGRCNVHLFENSKNWQEMEFANTQGQCLVDNLILKQLSPSDVPDLQAFHDAFRRLGPGLQQDRTIQIPWLGNPNERVTMLVYGRRE